VGKKFSVNDFQTLNKLEDIQNAHIHSVYLINTDKGFAKEMDPEMYLQMTKQLMKQSEIDL
jgi:hypothetical protein